MQNKYLNVIGMMSGTSADGIDISLVKTDGKNLISQNKNYFHRFKDSLRSELLNIMKDRLIKKIENKSYFDNLITQEHYIALRNSNILNETEIIGFHGQTIHHQPEIGLSIQVGDPTLLSKLTEKKVVFDFRTTDIKNGGQGAPIAPVYHKYILKKNCIKLPACIINLGGISNLTYCDDKNIIGFDTGPGNCLIDDYVKIKTNLNFDKNGEFGFKGRPNKKILELLSKDIFFNLKPPKSIDRNFLKKTFDIILKQNIQLYDAISTISFFTIQCIVNSLKFLPAYPENIIITGGGYKNKYLIHLLNKSLKSKIYDNVDLNFDPDFVEAELIAYLSARSIYKLPITFPSTTGVKTNSCGGNLFDYKNPL